MSETGRNVASTRVGSIDALRGIAAFSVMCHHFVVRGSLYGGEIAVPAALEPFARYGHMGVPVFFVISGAVLPLSLAAGGYAFRDAPRFVAKRLIRLDPVYLLSIVVTLLLWWAAARTTAFNGPAFSPSAASIASHLAYLTALLGYDWLCPVYWTLALEFQFYLAMAVAFPILDHGTGWLRAPLLLGLMACDVVNATDTLFVGWGSLFAVGIAAFFIRDRQRRHWLDVATCAIGLLVIHADHGLPVFLAALLTVLVILTDSLPRLAPLAWLGTISYSLYLFHWIIGQKIVNIGGRLAQDGTQRAMWLTAGILGSLVASWLVWLLVERPSQRWASRIRYSGAPAPEDR